MTNRNWEMHFTPTCQVSFSVRVFFPLADLSSYLALKDSLLGVGLRASLRRSALLKQSACEMVFLWRVALCLPPSSIFTTYWGILLWPCLSIPPRSLLFVFVFFIKSLTILISIWALENIENIKHNWRPLNSSILYFFVQKKAHKLLLIVFTLCSIQSRLNFSLNKFI